MEMEGSKMGNPNITQNLFFCQRETKWFRVPQSSEMLDVLLPSP